MKSALIGLVIVICITIAALAWFLEKKAELVEAESCARSVIAAVQDNFKILDFEKSNGPNWKKLTDKEFKSMLKQLESVRSVDCSKRKYGIPIGADGRPMVIEIRKLPEVGAFEVRGFFTQTKSVSVIVRSSK